MKRILLIMLFAMMTQLVKANDFYEHRSQGWFYFEEGLKKKEEQKQAIEEQDALFPPSSLSPLERVEQLQKRLKETHAKAIIEPTVENYLTYKRMEHKLMQRAQLIGDLNQKTLLADPSLDSNIENPYAQIARPIALKKIDQTREQKLKMLSQHYGLFFYFNSQCEYCHLIAPILKEFEKKFGWEILAISTDGGGLKEFPEFKIDNGSAQANSIEYFPALMLFDARENKIIPFHYGFATLDTLIEKVDLIDLEENR